MDARQRKSRARLSTAILALATEQPIDVVTVSEVADRAEVHRSTFYEHASSPIDLLRSVLREELDQVRTEYLVNADAADVAASVTATTEAVLHHVEAHADIYRRGLGESSGASSLHPMLSAHFQESTRLLLRNEAFAIPLRVDGVSPETVRESVAHFVADGTVGALEVWLALPEPRATAPFLTLLSALVPKWWPLNGNDATLP